MRWLILLTLLLPGGAAPAETGSVATTIEAAKPSTGLIEKGDFGIVIYALLFVIGFLLLRDLARERILRGTLWEGLPMGSHPRSRRGGAAENQAARAVRDSRSCSQDLNCLA